MKKYRINEKGFSFFKDGEEYEFTIESTKLLNNRKIINTKFFEILESTNYLDTYIDMIVNYIKTKNSSVVIEKAKEIVDVCKEYVKSIGINFSNFADTSKRSKSSVFLGPAEIAKIYHLSAVCKLLFPFTGSSIEMRHKSQIKLLSKVEKFIDCDDVVFKLYNITKSKVFKFPLDDDKMWDLFKKSATNEYAFVLIMFNQILDVMMVTFDMEHNPLSYITSTVSDVTKWFLIRAYNSKMSYNSDADVNEYIGNYTDNIAAFICYEDVLSRVTDFVLDRVKQDGKSTMDVDTILLEGGYNFDFNDLFITPFISLLLNVDHKEFTYKLNNYNKVILQLFFYYIIKDVFGEDMELLNVMKYLPLYDDIKRSYKSYKYSNLKEIFKYKVNIYGINNKALFFMYASEIMSKIKSVKHKYIFQESSDNRKVKMAKVELDILPFLDCIMNYKLNDEFEVLADYVSKTLKND